MTSDDPQRRRPTRDVGRKHGRPWPIRRRRSLLVCQRSRIRNRAGEAQPMADTVGRRVLRNRRVGVADSLRRAFDWRYREAVAGGEGPEARETAGRSACEDQGGRWPARGLNRRDRKTTWIVEVGGASCASHVGGARRCQLGDFCGGSAGAASLSYRVLSEFQKSSTAFRGGAFNRPRPPIIAFIGGVRAPMPRLSRIALPSNAPAMQLPR